MHSTQQGGKIARRMYRTPLAKMAEYIRLRDDPQAARSPELPCWTTGLMFDMSGS